MKKNIVCTNCLPGRNGTCENTSNECGAANSGEAAEEKVRKHTNDVDDAPFVEESTCLVKSALNRILPLPPVVTMASPTFTWGTLTSEQITRYFSDAYSELVHWRRNVFSIPSGKCGKEFISETARLLRAYAEATALESIALKAVTVFCILLLQKPYSASKSRDHVACLERRLVLWHAGDIPNLLMEGRTIQQRLRGRS